VTGCRLQSSKSRLTPRQMDRFTGPTLFDKIGRAVCTAGTLPAKEFFEAWEAARRIRRQFRGGRIVDMAGGHGLLAHILLLLDDSSPQAVVVDINRPASSNSLAAALVDQWPRLKGRISYTITPIEAFDVQPDDLIVSVHACGALTDTILDMAVTMGSRVAVLPCCHDLKRCDTGGLQGWMDGPLAVDAARAARLRAAGYRVFTRTIPSAITPQNRLLLGRPQELRSG
jgi:hypothetical protein